MTDAKLAQGWVIEFGGTPIPEVTTADFGQDTDEVEVTSHDSPNGAREYIAGLKTPQTVPMTVNWAITDHGFLFDILGDSTAVDTITGQEPDASETYSVDAWLKSLVIHAPATGEVETADLVWRTTGSLTRAGS